ncbi:hypothetical protein LguiA_032500 [Lonicera macranthoides]
MCGLKEEHQGGEDSRTMQGFEEQLLFQQQMQVHQLSQPWTLPPPPVQTLNPVHHFQTDPFVLPTYGGGGGGDMIFNRRSSGLQFAYDLQGGPSSTSSSDHHHLRLLSGQPGSGPFGLQSPEMMGKMSAQDLMDAKALAASKSHSEAERRRRERINNHLAKLRSLLPNTTKTDKASLLAEVIQHVKELKRQTSLIAESNPVPTEIDELTVDNASDEDGRLMIKASVCCEDRSDLLPDLIKTLKALRLRTLKAEITTLGGRVKNVLFITGDDEDSSIDEHCSINSIQEALKAVVEKTNGDESSSNSVKRQRTSNISILDHRSH